MEGGIFFLFFFVVVVIVIIASIVQSGAQRDRLTKLVQRLTDVRLESGFFGSKLLYTRPSWNGEVTFHRGSKNSPPHTRFEAQLRHPTGTLHVKPEGFFSGIGKFFGAQDIVIGDASFDARYVISGHPESFARGFLTPEIRGRIDRIGTLGRNPVLDMRTRRVRIQISKFLSDIYSLEKFLEEAEAVVNSAAGVGPKKKEDKPDDEGVEILDMGPAKEGECQVCGSEMKDDIVACTHCNTRHHRECWDYYGSCSTFGCGGKQRRNA